MFVVLLGCHRPDLTHPLKAKTKNESYNGSNNELNAVVGQKPANVEGCVGVAL